MYTRAAFEQLIYMHDDSLKLKADVRARYSKWYWLYFKYVLAFENKTEIRDYFILPDVLPIVLRNEPRHDKTNKLSVRPTKTKISLGIRPVWSESSLSAWRNRGSLATHWAHSEDSDQTGRMPRLIWVCWAHTHFVGFVMSWLKCLMTPKPAIWNEYFLS